MYCIIETKGTLTPTLSPTLSPISADEQQEASFEESQSDKKDGLHWTESFSIGVSVFVFVGCVAFFFIYRWCNKEYRANKEKYYPSAQQINAMKRVSDKQEPKIVTNEEEDEPVDDYWEQKKRTLDKEARQSLGIDIKFDPESVEQEEVEV